MSTLNFKKPANFWISLTFLFIVFLTVLFINYPRNGWLMGWDNVIPELNLAANFRRGLSVWQENQGLGVIGGHGFASTVVHTLIQYLLSFIVPLAHLRPVFTFLNVLIGTLGSFFLAAIVMRKFNKIYVYPLALISALYYMLNFGTVQMFYIPLEGFAFHYALLPWLLYTLIRFFELPDRLNLFFFLVVSLVASGQGFIPPLFIIFLIFLTIFCLVQIISDFSPKSIKKIILVLLVTFVSNAYWVMPVGFYAKNKSNVYLNSYNNLQTTDDFVYRSTKYGNLKDVVNLKGFIYEAIDGFVKGEAKYIYQPWIDHIERDYISAISYLFFIVIILGIISAIKNKNKYQIVLSLCFFVSFTFLASNVIPFSYLSNFLRNEMPVFKQAFRISFTKFSMSLALFYSLFLSIGLAFLFSLFKNTNFKRRFGLITAGIIILIIFWTWPVFQGNYFYKEIKLNLPADYLQLFNYFKEINPDQKIADFPQVSPAGWTKYRWGYIGSGFLWYGLSQPILDRNFDVWGNFNENYYWEVSQAVYSKNPFQFYSILTKYDIEWIIIDNSLSGFYSPRAIYINELENLLSKFANAKLEKTFGQIRIYHLSLESPPLNNIKFLHNVPRVFPQYRWNNYDKAYLEVGNYLSGKDPQFQSIKTYYYPFRSFFTGRKQEEMEFDLEENNDEIIYRTIIPKSLAGSHLLIPEFFKDEIIEIDKNDYSNIQVKYPKVYLDGEYISYNKGSSQQTVISLPYIKKGLLEVKVPKIKGLYSYSTQEGVDNSKGDFYKCGNFLAGDVNSENLIVDGKTHALRLFSKNTAYCFDTYLPDLYHRIGYLISITTRNISGKQLSFWLENQEARKAEIDTSVKSSASWTTSYFVQLPLESFGTGYSVHTKNTSIGDFETVNDIKNIYVYPFPFRFLSGLKIVDSINPDNRSINAKITSTGFTVQHPTLSFYQITASLPSVIEPETTLVLSQSYDRDWKAYELDCRLSLLSCRLKKLFPFVFLPEIKDHVLVNNWENGWILPSNRSLKPESFDDKTFIIVYLPQYLEYLGFAFWLLIPFIFLQVPRRVRQSVNN